MRFSLVLDGYEGFARRLAASAGARVDALLGRGRRQIRTETSNIVLGGEAWPGAIPLGRTGIRR